MSAKMTLHTSVIKLTLIGLKENLPDLFLDR